MRKAFLLCLLALSCSLVHAGSKCGPVGGTISTNFINSTTTFGSANGDLSGGVGVSVLSLTQNPDGTLTFHNQHSWVTTTGETIVTEPADAIGFPTAIPGFYAARYVDGVVVTGGTGRFKNASGKIYAWGAVDTKGNEVVLRYEGSVCFSDQDSK